MLVALFEDTVTMVRTRLTQTPLGAGGETAAMRDLPQQLINNDTLALEQESEGLLAQINTGAKA